MIDGHTILILFLLAAALVAWKLAGDLEQKMIRDAETTPEA